MKLMTRIGKNVLEALGSNGEFVPALHSVGEKFSLWKQRRILQSFSKHRQTKKHQYFGNIPEYSPLY